MIADEKRDLRRLIRARYPGPDVRREESLRLCEHILQSEWYRHARVVGGYIPLPREADITPVLQDALCTGRTLVLPLCGPAPRMSLRHIASLEELLPGSYGIPEPPKDAEVVPVEVLDLLLVPLEGVDLLGMRLGKGGGYYDHLLSGKQVRTMGCALSWQMADVIPSEAWDMPLMACAHPDGIAYFGLRCAAASLDENMRNEEENHGEQKETEGRARRQALYPG